MRENRAREHPKTSTFFFLWTIVEDVVLQAWTEKAMEAGPEHISLHFDGLRLDTAKVGCVESHCGDVEAYILQKTKFHVRIRPKVHGVFMRLLSERT